MELVITGLRSRPRDAVHRSRRGHARGGSGTPPPPFAATARGRRRAARPAARRGRRAIARRSAQRAAERGSRDRRDVTPSLLRNHRTPLPALHPLPACPLSLNRPALPAPPHLSSSLMTATQCVGHWELRLIHSCARSCAGARLHARARTDLGPCVRPASQDQIVPNTVCPERLGKVQLLDVCTQHVSSRLQHARRRRIDKRCEPPSNCTGCHRPCSEQQPWCGQRGKAPAAKVAGRVAAVTARELHNAARAPLRGRPQRSVNFSSARSYATGGPRCWGSACGEI